MAATRKAAAKPASTPTTTVDIPVRPGEEPWTAEELAEVRTELTEEVDRMTKALRLASAELEELLRDGSDGAGRDPVDVGSSNFERDQELSIAQNAREMAEQLRVAIHLFDTGEYGLCEVCGQPIGKARLQVFPRATLCVTCKQREERR